MRRTVAFLVFFASLAGCAPASPTPTPGLCDRMSPCVLARHADGLLVNDLRVSPDGALLASAADGMNGATGETLLIDVRTGATVWRRDGAAYSVAFSPDGALLATGAAPVTLVRTSDRTVSRTFDGTGGAVAFSSDGALLAAQAGRNVRVFRVSDGTQLLEVAQADTDRERIWTVLFAPGDQQLVTASGQFGFGSPHGDVRVWNLADGARVATLPCTCVGARVSTDGTRLATACWNSVRLYDTTTWREAAGQMPTTSAMGVAWSRTDVYVGNFQSSLEVRDPSTLVLSSMIDGPDMIGSFKALDVGGSALFASGWDDPAIIRFALTPISAQQ